MTTFERIKLLAKKKGKNLKEVALELDFGENAFYKWKKSSPSAENIKKVADYFDVSVDYLLETTNNPVKPKENLTVEEALDSVMSYDGKPLTDNDREVLRRIIEGYLNTK
ncbi:MAG TPA: helix-turn-helix transcriptional regulator [Bacilli bacterium]|nr:helix-turn-helix transcriptional regulator [Bacilli bacterium]